MILQPNTSEILLRAEFASIDLVKKDLLGAFSVIRKEEGGKSVGRLGSQKGESLSTQEMWKEGGKKSGLAKGEDKEMRRQKEKKKSKDRRSQNTRPQNKVSTFSSPPHFFTSPSPSHPFSPPPLLLWSRIRYSSQQSPSNNLPEVPAT